MRSLYVRHFALVPSGSLQLPSAVTVPALHHSLSHMRHLPTCHATFPAAAVPVGAPVPALTLHSSRPEKGSSAQAASGNKERPRATQNDEWPCHSRSERTAEGGNGSRWQGQQKPTCVRMKEDGCGSAMSVVRRLASGGLMTEGLMVRAAGGSLSVQTGRRLQQRKARRR
jgi:hypothetical protein